MSSTSITTTPVRLTRCYEASVATFAAGAIRATINVQRLALPRYVGDEPVSRWQKPIVGPPDRPFAELQVVADLERQGWTAGWVFRPAKFLSSWEPRKQLELPNPVRMLTERVGARVGRAAGCWDVVAWKDENTIFMELKELRSTDGVRRSQLKWREAALELGVPEAAFTVVEWKHE